MPRTMLVLIATAYIAFDRAAFASDGDCIRARDTHGDFKAILMETAFGTPQYDTVRHSADGNVKVTRWMSNVKTLTRTMAGGVFATETVRFEHNRSVQLTISRTIGVKAVLPLQPNTTLNFITTATPAPLFFNRDLDEFLSKNYPSTSTKTKMVVGPEYKTKLGGCALQVMDISWALNTGMGSLVARSIFAPALDYFLEEKLEQRVGDRTTTTTLTKVQSIEPWSP